MGYLWIFITKGTVSQRALVSQLIRQEPYRMKQNRDELYKQVGEFISYLQNEGKIQLISDDEHDRIWIMKK